MLKIYPIPAGEPVSTDYEITLNGKPAQAYTARVSAIPFNRVWPGQQRPIDQTEIASFLYFASDEPVTVKVKAARNFSDVAIRPLSRGIKAACDGNEITFTLERDGQYTLELDGFHYALHIFANPIFDFGVKADDAGVIYFGPGVHEPGYIDLSDGQTLYIDAGAVVKTSVSIKGKNIRVVGEGILDNSWEKRDDPDCVRAPIGCMKIFASANVLVEGIIFRDSSVWTATIFNSDNIIFDNIKAIGMWRYNSDGIDFVNSANGVVKNSFLRNFDDVIVLKGLKGWDTRNVENIFVKNCVLWCDWGRNLEIGAETCADEYRNIIFEDCDLIHCAHINLDLQNGDRAKVHALIFDNIRVEYSRYTLEPIYQHSDEQVFEYKEGYLPQLFFAHLYNGMWSKDYLYGENRDVKFRNIQVFLDEGLSMPPSTFVGVNEDHQTYNINIEDLFVNGEKIDTLEKINLNTNEFAHDITIK